MVDWKIVFSTNMNHYIFIKQKNDSEYLNFYYQYQFEIEKEESFFFLMPNSMELKNKNPKEYIAKYGPLLRTFIESPNKKTLFAEEDVLKALIKEDKRENFFKFLSKNKKNIVLFCYDNLHESAKKQEHLYVNLSKEDLDFHLSLFYKFTSIKSEVRRTYNPFKNPQKAYADTNQSKND